MKTARSKSLFRPNLKKFTTQLEIVNCFAEKLIDESWVWGNNELCDIKTDNVDESAGFCLFDSAPLGVKKSGEAYARWCILISSLVFQIKNVEPYVKKITNWWGEGEHPQFKMPETEQEWGLLFDLNEKWYEARKSIFSEIVSSKSFNVVGKVWETKIAMDRIFNVEDATRLAVLFPKSFADPFLFKAQRAIWQFVISYGGNKKTPIVNLPGSSNPNELNALLDKKLVNCHDVLIEKLKNGGLVRDEMAEKAARSFVLLHNQESKIKFDGFKIIGSSINNETTDY